MRRLRVSAAFTVLLFVLGGCRTPKRVRAIPAGEEDTTLRSVVFTGDEKQSLQLIRGFHAIEGNQWRWTKGRFSVTLRPPYQSERNGAYLMVKLSVPDSIIQHLGGTALRANVNGTAIDGETYTRTGEYTYRREVPAAALRADAVTVEFGLDKFLAAGQVEARELGVIVAMVGLEAK